MTYLEIYISYAKLIIVLYSFCNEILASQKIRIFVTYFNPSESLLKTTLKYKIIIWEETIFYDDAKVFCSMLLMF